jgi:hypothetical protein
MKFIAVMITTLLFGIFFIIDPFKWWPIDHLVGKGKTPCTKESTKPSCTGKINFFNKP